LKDVTIIIVSWNVEELLIECLKSIYANAEGLSLEIIVVDNNSSDGTVDSIRAGFPGVRIIENRENVGFAAANNQAFPLCEGRYILLLNPDTQIVGDAIQKMIRFADSNLDFGLVGPRLEFSNGEIQFVSARSFPTPVSYFWYTSFLGQVFPKSRIFGKYYLTYWDHRTSREVDCITGAAMLIPRKTLSKVGVLDESHAMYLEDADYCCRVVKAGGKIYYLADARVIHHGGKSSMQAFLDTRLMILDACRAFHERYGRKCDPQLFRIIVILAGFIRLPALSLVRFCSLFGLFRNRKVKRINLKGEISAILWGLGLIQPRQIQAVRISASNSVKSRRSTAA
jgi:O-antigen biosynthesis protein